MQTLLLKNYYWVFQPVLQLPEDQCGSFQSVKSFSGMQQLPYLCLAGVLTVADWVSG